MKVGVTIWPFPSGIIVQFTKRPSTLRFVAFPSSLSPGSEETAPVSMSVMQSPTFFLCMISLWSPVGVKGRGGRNVDRTVSMVVLFLDLVGFTKQCEEQVSKWDITTQYEQYFPLREKVSIIMNIKPFSGSPEPWCTFSILGKFSALGVPTAPENLLLQLS